jgi:hypothetical protein
MPDISNGWLVRAAHLPPSRQSFPQMLLCENPEAEFPPVGKSKPLKNQKFPEWKKLDASVYAATDRKPGRVSQRPWKQFPQVSIIRPQSPLWLIIS